ncbi:MAG: PEP-CTERM sorting domain-containing protein [Phycisphaerae bacterium]|nr:PEP-CTERM sorting domain-containing protein [Phycisphaerae bacterium]
MKRVVILIVVIFVLPHVVQAGITLDGLSWSVQYLIDQSQSVMGVDQFSQPRNNRGLALSPDNGFLYAGYNNPSGSFCVRKIDLSKADYTEATVANLLGVTRGKAIAVDDAGRVYLAEDGSVMLYDPNLSAMQTSITTTNCEGVAVQRDGGQLVLYTSDRTTGKLSKWLLSESGGNVTGAAKDASFGTSGDVTLPANLRGVELDSTGRIWVAGYGSKTGYVVAADGASYSSISTGSATPMDIGFDGDIALVPQEYGLGILRYNVGDLSSSGAALVPPLSDLELTATPSTGGTGAIDCIAVIPGVGFYVSGDGINTAGDKSTYGTTDSHSGWQDGKFYTDLCHDDNDPILFAVPEPATLGLLVLGGLALFHKKRT